MKILVTGAGGYLGRGIVSELLNQGHTVIATCHSDTNCIDKRAIIKECDIFTIEDPYTFFDRPEILLHLAWRDGFVHYSEKHMKELPEHIQFIDKLIKSPIKSIVVMGTMHEVGFYEGSIDENSSCHPESYYGIAKNALREYVRVACKRNDKDFKWLRAFYIVGNSGEGSSIFGKIMTAAKNGEKEFPFTMGLNQFDFMDYDIFSRYVAYVSTQNEVGGIINICSGRPEKLADRVERFIRDNALNIKLNYGAFPDRPYDSKAVWGNDEKLRAIIEAKK